MSCTQSETFNTFVDSLAVIGIVGCLLDQLAKENEVR